MRCSVRHEYWLVSGSFMEVRFWGLFIRVGGCINQDVFICLLQTKLREGNWQVEE